VASGGLTFFTEFPVAAVAIIFIDYQPDILRHGHRLGENNDGVLTEFSMFS
jgi:hypothetical protein